VEKVRSNPFIPNTIPVHGFIYHVENGKLQQVV
jgi:carbonic anhydrase